MDSMPTVLVLRPAAGPAAGGAPLMLLATGTWGVVGPRKSLLGQMEDLKVAQTATRERRKQISRDLRHVQSRKRRLKARARQLNNDDLAAVQLMRADVEAAAAADPEAAARLGPEPLAGSPAQARRSKVSVTPP